MSQPEVIVLGLGGVGSAALHHVASRGKRVLGIDRFPDGHDRGSSHGQTRVIRQAYFEHPDYVPLLREAYRWWHRLEAEVDERLFHQVGLLQVGSPEGVVISGVRQAAQTHGLEIEELDAEAIRPRFPGVAVGADDVGLFESQAGYLMVERCVLAHLRAARQAGAQTLTDRQAVGWESTPAGVVVRTDNGETFCADRLILAPGAWAGDLLGDLGVQLRVLRKHLHWYAVDETVYQQANGFSTFMFEVPEGIFYGFPAFDSLGLKVAEHTGGELVDDPLNVSRSPDPEDDGRVRDFLDCYLPYVGTQRTRHATCLYTMSPDEHFLLDRHPRDERVAFAAGLSGHGFKFASVLGQALADLAIDGGSELPIDFLSLGRFQDRSSVND